MFLKVKRVLCESLNVNSLNLNAGRLSHFTNKKEADSFALESTSFLEFFVKMRKKIYL